MYNQGYGQQQQYGAPPGPPPGQAYGQVPGQYGAPPPSNQYGAPPPGQYGAPPPNQYGAPQGQYGQAPPPQQQQWGGAPPSGYGAPPGQGGHVAPPQQQSYGAPPPQQSYGAPPQQNYGAPPQQNYGAPPSQQNYGMQPQQSFGAPPGPPSGQGARFLGTSIPSPPPALPVTNLPGYNPQFDADRIRKATKGFGTDEKVLIDTLAPKDAFQIDVLSRTFEQQVGKSLQKTLEKELSSWLEYVLVLKALGPLGGDLHLLNRACKGIGTHEDLLNELLLGRTNEEIFHLKEGYKRVYGKDLVQVVRGELSMKTERLFNMALSGTRDESPMVNHQQVQQDVEALYRAGAGKIGTDEIAICGILLSRSDAHLQAIASAFPQRHRTTLSKMILSEFSGHMQDGLYYIARGAEMDGQGVVRDVELLEASMSGMGTKDERLCYRLVRLSWNKARFAAIKNQYQATYGKSLRRRVEGETTGKYEKALVAIIDQN